MAIVALLAVVLLLAGGLAVVLVVAGMNLPDDFESPPKPTRFDY